MNLPTRWAHTTTLHYIDFMLEAKKKGLIFSHVETHMHIKYMSTYASPWGFFFFHTRESLSFYFSFSVAIFIISFFLIFFFLSSLRLAPSLNFFSVACLTVCHCYWWFWYFVRYIRLYVTFCQRRERRETIVSTGGMKMLNSQFYV